MYVRFVKMFLKLKLNNEYCYVDCLKKVPLKVKAIVHNLICTCFQCKTIIQLKRTMWSGNSS